jgi:hypothetical protein
MWGTRYLKINSLGDLGNVIEAHRFGGRRSDFFTSRKLAPGNLGLFQQHRPKPALGLDEIPQRSEPLT